MRASTILFAITTLFLALPGVAPLSHAQDEMDDVLGGFDDDEVSGTDAESEGTGDGGEPASFAADRIWELGGDVSLGSSYNYRKHSSATGTDYRGFQRLRLQTDLQLDVKLPFDWKLRAEGYGFYDFAYVANRRSSYSKEVKNDYEWEIDTREVYVQGEVAASVDLKLGRQIVNWGRSDSLRVLDVLNPLDNREPGLVDIEDLRLAVGMARLDYYPKQLDGWSFQLLVIPEYRDDELPSVGNDFNPSQKLPPMFSFPRGDTPRNIGSVPEYAAATTGTFSGWDISFYAARLYENQRFAVRGLQGDHHFTLLGTGGNWTLGSWLLKGEIGWLDSVEYGRLFFVRDVGILEQTTDKSRLDAMAGIEYYGFTDTQIAFEVVNRHIFDYDSDFGLTQEDSIESALRVTVDFLNARLHATALAFVLGSHGQDGSVVRVQATYDLRDALVIEGGIVLYQKGDNLAFEQIAKNDRLFLRLEYSF